MSIGQVDRATVLPSEGAGRGEPLPEHQAACLTCYRFYRRGLTAEGWRLEAAGLAPRGWGSASGASGAGRTGRARARVLSELPCHYCGCATRIWVRLWRNGRVDGERLHLSICHECGHVEPIESAGIDVPTD